jgi:hypothetical protein
MTQNRVTFGEALQGTLDLIIAAIFFYIFQVVFTNIDQWTDLSTGEHLILILLVGYVTIWAVREFSKSIPDLFIYLVQTYRERNNKEELVFNPPA